jgi:hypothetical protein
MRWRAPALLVFALLVCAMFAPAQALGSTWLTPDVVKVKHLDVAPGGLGYRITARQAIRIADHSPRVRRELAKRPGLVTQVEAPLYTPHTWAVQYSRPGGDREIEVHVDGATGRIYHVFTGPQVGWILARGYQPSVGGSTLNIKWVWGGLCLLFRAPFFDPRRPFRMLHLDLLMMLGFSASQAFFNVGDLNASVPISYVFLAYLLVRLLVIGFRPREGRGPLVPIAPTRVLAVLLVLLVAFRVGLNATGTQVTDVGLASVVGADRIMHKQQLYTDNAGHGDTYGPINYVAYIPFELLFPWHGDDTNVPAAQAAAITFDMLTIIGLFLLGARLRRGPPGKRLGLALAFGWAAYPYSTYVLQANTNDSLVAMLTVFALLALTSPPARGAWLGLASAAKFVPLALAPLLAAGNGDRSPRSVARFAVPLVLIIAFSILVYLPDGGLHEFWNCTLGYQLSRQSPFSIWGLVPALAPGREVMTVATALLAAALFFVPRRRSSRQVAALAGGLTVAMQLTAQHWFYFYLVWIAPLALVAFFMAYADKASAGLEAESAAEPASA